MSQHRPPLVAVSEAIGHALGGPLPDDRVSFRWLALVPVVLVVHVLAAASRYWAAEDAYITFRYARSVVAGHGFRYNAADPEAVEGYSNFLWLMGAVVCEAVGLPPDLAMSTLSVGLNLGTLWLIAWTARRHLELSVVATLGATGVLALFPPFVVWATSGLEVAAQTFCFAASVVWLTFGEGRRAAIGAGIAALALALLRIEGIAWAPVILATAGAVRAVEKRPVREPLAWFLGVVVLGYGVYTAWRLSVFGRPFSNTVYAKMGGGVSRGTLISRGLRYVAVGTVSLLLPILVPFGVLLGAAGGHGVRWLWVGALALAYPSWSVVVGGDYMEMYRFLVPSAPFLALCLGGLLHYGLVASRSVPGVAVVAAGLALVGHLPAQGVWLTPTALLKSLSFVSGEVAFEGGTFRFENELRPHVVEWMALKKFAEPGEKVVLAAIGRNAYYTDVHVIDQCALVARQPELERFRRNRVGLRAGHDSCLMPMRFYHYDPDILVFRSFLTGTRRAHDDLVRRVAVLKKADPKERFYPDFVHVKLGERLLLFGIGLRKASTPAEREAGYARYREKLREVKDAQAAALAASAGG